MDIIKRNSPFNSKYRVVMVPYEPRQYLEVYDVLDKEASIDEEDLSYLFKVTKNNKIKNIQPLDSGSENVVFDLLKQEIYALNSYLGDKVRVWCKNLNTSSVNADYLDKNHTFHKSYFDFIIKFSNGAFLYIEVKNQLDIDPDKTQLLKESYADYFKKREKTLFDYPLVIAVWTVSGKFVRHENFYDNSIIKVDLNSLPAQKVIAKLAQL
jgi:hypothetical protein